MCRIDRWMTKPNRNTQSHHPRSAVSPIPNKGSQVFLTTLSMPMGKQKPPQQRHEDLEISQRNVRWRECVP